LASGTDEAGDVPEMRRERINWSFALDELNIVLAADGRD